MSLLFAIFIFDKILGQQTGEEYLVTNKKIVVEDKDGPISVTAQWAIRISANGYLSNAIAIQIAQYRC